MYDKDMKGKGMTGTEQLYPQKGGGRTDKHMGMNPKGGGPTKNELPNPNSGGFKEGFNQKNQKPFGC